MDDWRRNPLVWLVVAVLAAGVLYGVVSGVNPRTAALQLPAGCTGGATYIPTEISQAYSDTLFRNVWRVLTIVNGGGECASIAWSPEQLEQKAGGQIDVKSPVTINIKRNGQTQTFSVNPTGNSVNTIIPDGDAGNNLLCENPCAAAFPSYVPGTWYRGGFGFLTCKCPYLQKYGDFGSFSGSTVTSTSTTFEIPGLGAATSTGDQQSVSIGNKVGIKWVGNLWSGRFLTAPLNYQSFKPTAVGATGQWILILPAESQVASLYADAVQRLKSHENAKTVADQYRSSITSYLVDQKSRYLSTESQATDYSFSGNSMVVNLRGDVAFPTFVIDLDAAFFGIVKLVGQPKLACSSAPLSIRSGESTTTSVTITNVAPDSTAVFGVGASCSQGVLAKVVGNSLTPSLSSGQSTQATVSVTGSAPSNDLQASCTVNVYDSNKADNKDTCQFSVNVQHVGCSAEGQKFCSPDFASVLTCSGGQTSEQACSYGCEFVSGQAKCKTTPSKEVCNNLVDDDGNGQVDCKDFGCTNSPFCGEPLKEICGNAVDDDADGLTDSADPDCKRGNLLRNIALGVMIVAVVSLLGYVIWTEIKKRRGH